MNLNAIVAPIVATINPPVQAYINVSTGYTTAADGTRTPTLPERYAISLQVQPLGFKDLQQLAGLNIQGVERAAYLNGNARGVDRPLGAGGDIFEFADGTKWKVTAVLEPWDANGWTKVGLTKQMSRT